LLDFGAKAQIGGRRLQPRGYVLETDFYPIVLLHSMIGYWHIVLSSVCLSVHPSVRLSVTRCIVAVMVGIQAKSCTSVFLAGMFLFVRSNISAVGCIV